MCGFLQEAFPDTPVQAHTPVFVSVTHYIIILKSTVYYILDCTSYIGKNCILFAFVPRTQQGEHATYSVFN